METEINLPFVTADASGPKHLALKLTRARFEQLVGELLERTMGPVRQCLKDAGLEPRQIDEVVMVGGSTRMPQVARRLREEFGRPVESNRPLQLRLGRPPALLGGEMRLAVEKGKYVLREDVAYEIAARYIDAEFAKRIEGTGVRLLDTRKTIPGLRALQKYAVRAGGGRVVRAASCGQRGGAGRRTGSWLAGRGRPPAPGPHSRKTSCSGGRCRRTPCSSRSAPRRSAAWST